MLSPLQIAACGSESGHQRAVMQWVATVGARHWPEMHRLMAVPNGANYGGSRKEGARMRAEGLRSGVPDLFWPWRAQPGSYPGLWIEMKRPGAERHRDWDRSAQQVDWTEWLAETGWAVVVCCGWVPAVHLLADYARAGLHLRLAGDAHAVVNGVSCFANLPMPEL